MRALTGVETRKTHLFGYSGGGQFVHRYAFTYPEQVAAMVIGASGWYTFPDPDLDYPLGLRRTANSPAVCQNPAEFLNIPACVLVGDKDTRRDAKLNKSRRIDAHQGTTRLERGQRWVAAMSASADTLKLDILYQFNALTGADDHSFSRNVKRGWMAAHVFEFLFSATLPVTVILQGSLTRLERRCAFRLQSDLQ